MSATIEKPKPESKPNYQTKFETHWTAILGIFRYFITQFADESVEIAARAVALAAPLPNAINMYNVAMGELGWSPLAAFSFALTLEIVVFLLVEIALLMWDGYLAKPDRYRVPFIVSIAVVLISVAVVMRIVYVLEAYKIMALLPVVSLCSFAGIGLKRWNERSVQADIAEVASKKVVQETAQIEQLTAQIEQLELHTSAQLELHTVQSADIEQLNSKIDGYQSNEQKLSSQINDLRVKNAALSGQLKVVNTDHIEVFNSAQKVYKNGDILHGLESLETHDRIRAIAQRQLDSVGKVNKSKIATLVNCSRGTVQTVLS